MSAGSRLSLPSYTILELRHDQRDRSGSGDMAPIYSRGTTDVEVQHLNLTGTPLYGIFMRNVNNLILGQIDMRLSAGLGVRIDNHGGDRAVKVRNIRIDNVYVSGAGSHAVETYGVDGITIGTVTARNVGESGLLLNDTINATIGTVDAENAGAGTGYAAFRMANRNGRVGSSYPTNIRVGTVRARRRPGHLLRLGERRRGHRPGRHRQHRQQLDPDRELLQRDHRRRLRYGHRRRRGADRGADGVPAVVGHPLPEPDREQYQHPVEPVHRYQQHRRQRHPVNSTLAWC